MIVAGMTGFDEATICKLAGRAAESRKTSAKTKNCQL